MGRYPIYLPSDLETDWPQNFLFWSLIYIVGLLCAAIAGALLLHWHRSNVDATRRHVQDIKSQHQERVESPESATREARFLAYITKLEADALANLTEKAHDKATINRLEGLLEERDSRIHRCESVNASQSLIIQMRECRVVKLEKDAVKVNKKHRAEIAKKDAVIAQKDEEIRGVNREFQVEKQVFEKCKWELWNARFNIKHAEDIRRKNENDNKTHSEEVKTMQEEIRRLNNEIKNHNEFEEQLEEKLRSVTKGHNNYTHNLTRKHVRNYKRLHSYLLGAKWRFIRDKRLKAVTHRETGTMLVDTEIQTKHAKALDELKSEVAAEKDALRKQLRAKTDEIRGLEDHKCDHSSCTETLEGEKRRVKAIEDQLRDYKCDHSHFKVTLEEEKIRVKAVEDQLRDHKCDHSGCTKTLEEEKFGPMRKEIEEKDRKINELESHKCDPSLCTRADETKEGSIKGLEKKATELQGQVSSSQNGVNQVKKDLETTQAEFDKLKATHAKCSSSSEKVQKSAGDMEVDDVDEHFPEAGPSMDVDHTGPQEDTQGEPSVQADTDDMIVDPPEQVELNRLELENNKLKPEVLQLQQQNRELHQFKDQHTGLQGLVQQQSAEIERLKAAAQQATTSSLALDSLSEQRKALSLQQYQLAVRESQVTAREEALKRAANGGSISSNTPPQAYSTRHENTAPAQNSSKLNGELKGAKAHIRKLVKQIEAEKQDYNRLDKLVYSRNPQFSEEYRATKTDLDASRAEILSLKDRIASLEVELEAIRERQGSSQDTPSQAGQSIPLDGPAFTASAANATPIEAAANGKREHEDDDDDLKVEEQDSMHAKRPKMWSYRRANTKNPLNPLPYHPYDSHVESVISPTIPPTALNTPVALTTLSPTTVPVSVTTLPAASVELCEQTVQDEHMSGQLPDHELQNEAPTEQTAPNVQDEQAAQEIVEDEVDSAASDATNRQIAQDANMAKNAFRYEVELREARDGKRKAT